MKPKLLSLGFAVPDNFVMSQEEALALLGYTSPLAKRIFMNSAIEKRHFAINPIGKSWQQLRDEYTPKAIALSRQAVYNCFDSQWSPKHISCLVFSSVTDYSTPALGYHLAKELGLKEDVTFTNIQGEGCQSSIPGLQRAYDYFLARGQPALVVNTEICSSTFFSSDESDLETVTTNALFADASSAALVGHDNDPRHPFIIDFLSLYDPVYLDILGYTWVDGRLKCRLDRSVPKVIPGLLAEAVRRLLAKNGLAVKDVRYWAIHPGGPAILTKVEELLGLTRDDTWASWETLRRFGNVSSATLAIIAKRLQDTLKEPEGYAVGVTMGAGGAVEAILVRYGDSREESGGR